MICHSRRFVFDAIQINEDVKYMICDQKLSVLDNIKSTAGLNIAQEIDSPKTAYQKLCMEGIHHITSHGDDGSRPQGPPYPIDNTKIIDYATLRIDTL